MTFQSRNGRGPQGPEELFRELGDQFDQFMKGFKGKVSYLYLGILGLFLIIGALGSYYTVEPDEEAVVVRLGAYYATTQPGLHFKFPFGIDKIYKVQTKRRLRAEFGFRSKGKRDSRTVYEKKSFQGESLMLAGDLNVADVEWIVQYQIADPKKFLFHARSPIRSIRDVSEAMMRRVVGDRFVNDVLNVGRVEVAAEVQRLMQEVLDRYDMGVHIATVELQDVNPPEVVKPSFNEVNAAKQEQEELINLAEKEYNKVIPEAKGKAEELISKAEGYATALINRSKGDAEKFTAVLKEYRKAPAVTRKRIYLETMEDLFTRFQKLTVVDSKVKGVLPVFGGKGSSLSEVGK